MAPNALYKLQQIHHPKAKHMVAVRVTKRYEGCHLICYTVKSVTLNRSSLLQDGTRQSCCGGKAIY